MAGLLEESISLSKSRAKAKSAAVQPIGPIPLSDLPVHRSATQSQIQSEPSSRILTSAFRVPKVNRLWTINVNVTKSSFIRWSAQFRSDGTVKLRKTESDLGPEYIEIATDWINGEKAYLKGESHFGTGFLGQGSTKRALYVCLKQFYSHIASPRHSLSLVHCRPVFRERNMR